MLWRRLITKSESSDKVTSRRILCQFINQEHSGEGFRNRLEEPKTDEDQTKAMMDSRLS